MVGLSENILMLFTAGQSTQDQNVVDILGYSMYNSSKGTDSPSLDTNVMDNASYAPTRLPAFPLDKDMMRQLQVIRYVVLGLYLATFCFGLVGNTLTIVVIVVNKRMKTVATCFILNLAVADDLFMLSLPFHAYSTFRSDWVFGSALCKVMSAFKGINLFASIYTMVLMSIDRFLAIKHPLKSMRYRTIRHAVLVCVSVWIVCFVIMTPFWIYADTTAKSPKSDASRCMVAWPKDNFWAYSWFWTNFELVVGFVLPISIMAVCYMQLVKHLVRSRGPLQNQARRPVKKVTIMVLIVTAVFVICWTPYHIINYTNAQKMKAYSEKGSRPPLEDILYHIIFNTVAQALVFVSSCSNPFIYAISSKNFRRLYVDAVCKCWPCAEGKRPISRSNTMRTRSTEACRVRNSREKADSGLPLNVTGDHQGNSDVRDIDDFCRHGDDDDTEREVEVTELKPLCNHS